ncbi:hypothetical protein [Ruegeria atlantica]|uniref:hypothetical protein n=1 Tax=Ruegeria atlantica TaxID=81569 RepID=UPI002493E25C|nr:hypothetical protein [Ruegeria atlantica]
MEHTRFIAGCLKGILFLTFFSMVAAPSQAGRNYKTISVGTAIEIIELSQEIEETIKNEVPGIYDEIKYNLGNFAPQMEASSLAVQTLSELPTGNGVLMWFPVQRMGDNEKIGTYLPQGPIPVGVGADPALAAASFLSMPLETVSPDLANAILGKLQYENGQKIPGALLKSSMSKSYFLWFKKVENDKIQMFRIDDTANFLQEALLEVTRLKILRRSQESDDTLQNLARRSQHMEKLSHQYQQQLRESNLKFEIDRLMRARSESSRQLKAAYENMERARASAKENNSLAGIAMIFGMADLVSSFGGLSEKHSANANYNESAADRLHVELQQTDIQIINIYVDGIGLDQNLAPHPSIPNPWKKDMQ